MEYLLKVSAVIVIFYFSYKLFLQRDTFFEKNRWFLLLGLITSFIVPFMVFTEYVEYTPLNLDQYTLTETVEQSNNKTLSLLDYLPIIYVTGLMFFLVKFLIEIASLFTLIFKNKPFKKGPYRFVETNHEVSPFSFFNWIVYNPNQFNSNELEQIITHEKVHVQQYHSIDVLLTQIACILLWFNPFIWLYNKDLKQNLEFLADHAAINFTSCKKAYQYTLLKTSMPTHQLALSNHFYNSLIKKRIVMLQKSKSKKINQIKFALVIPMLLIFLMSFNTKTVYIEKEIPVNDLLVSDIPIVMENTTETNLTVTTPKNITVAKEKPTNIEKLSTKTLAKKEIIEALVTKKSSDAELDKIASMLKNSGVTIKFKGVKRNDEGEIIAIKIDANSKKSSANFNLDSDEAIKPIKIIYNIEDNSLSVGNATTKEHATSYYFTNDGKTKAHKAHASGKASSVYVFSNDDNHVHETKTDDVHIISSGGKSKIHTTKKGKSVNVISNDDNNIELIFENDNENDNVNETEDIVITNGTKGNTFKVKSIGKGKEGSKFYISTDEDEEPIYLIDGKEVEKIEVDKLDPKSIEKVEVLKGDSATKKYGDKAKDGVVSITTKK